ncbi:MAG: dual specificity protein phosphatase family protein [Acidimicrobiia bacterium]|nr:dual specificity protein phosphatase family protein [Acidimicrobiia bacterium]
MTSLASPTPGPIPGSYWIVADRFAAGPHPSERTVDLRLAGLDTVFDLTESGERNDGARGAIRYPIPDLGVPDVATMTMLLDEIDAALARRSGVYLHCHAGVGRTGTVVGCWLIRHGHAGPLSAVEVIARLRSGIEERPLRSPETDEQRAFVVGWGEFR